MGPRAVHHLGVQIPTPATREASSAPCPRPLLSWVEERQDHRLPQEPS